ncbi:hypothetical protein BJY04DRAFT_211398 [Aspergillus karnatakaensis]|uniref:uncharacterized protein n=1 Tax=Aspergillus karnatakaensis TaxID=1810916 RepID=UPI003CCD380A
MASPELANPDSLEVLTATLNQTLIETGRFFRSRASLQSRAQLKRALPVAHEQFQSALDNLSEQIFIAKAFLERDYEVIRARKAALRKRPTADAVMGELETPGAPQVESAAELTAAGATFEENKDNASNSPVKIDEQPDSEKNLREAKTVPVKEVKKEESKAGPLPIADGAGTGEINFDSLLDNPASNEFDLNLDFGDDGSAGNDNFFNSNFGDPNAGAGMDANLESGHDSNALTTGGDAFDLELQKFTTDPGDSHDQFGGNNDDIMGPGESSFDDLFMESENIGGNDNGDQDLLGGDGLMELNELDDSWFT